MYMHLIINKELKNDIEILVLLGLVDQAVLK